MGYGKKWDYGLKRSWISSCIVQESSRSGWSSSGFVINNNSINYFGGAYSMLNVLHRLFIFTTILKSILFYYSYITAIIIIILLLK